MAQVIYLQSHEGEIMKHIVKFSGGKDSTAMLLMMLERGLPVDEIIFCDTGLEYPEVYEHIKEVEKFTGRQITVLHPPHTFEYFLPSLKYFQVQLFSINAPHYHIQYLISGHLSKLVLIFSL